ncbi:MAG: sigma-54 dependent transcriptional regulator [Polyangiaceae bacterium]
MTPRSPDEDVTAPRVQQVTATPNTRVSEHISARKPVLALTILWHPYAPRAGERLLLHPVANGGEVQISRVEPMLARPGPSHGRPLEDPYISRKPVLLRGGPGDSVTLLTSPEGTRVVCDRTPIEDSIEIPAEKLARGVPITLADRVVLLLHLVEPAATPTADSLGMVGESTGIRRVRTHIERVADLNVPVLIRGETGTGKELVAGAIHEKSTRRSGPFVAVNLAAVPKELAAAELFGSAKGGYTGARDREGYFQAARGGTLFLDELGEAPLDVQVMLLRVLETGEMYPVGASTPVPADVRLIAATDANLENQIREGRFKAPLLHRLSGYEIRIPPLRQRREDIGVLVYHFAKEELALIGESHRLVATEPHQEPWLPPALATRLATFDWPGNIRQLRNVVRRIVIGSRGQATTQLDPQLEAELSGFSTSPPPAHTASPPVAAPAPVVAPLPDAPPSPVPAPSPVPTGPRRKPSDVTEEELESALRACDWDIKAAADELGVQRPSMYDLIQRSQKVRTASAVSVEEIERSFREHGGDLDQMVAALQVSKRALSRRLKEMGLKGH